MLPVAKLNRSMQAQAEEKAVSEPSKGLQTTPTLENQTARCIRLVDLTSIRCQHHRRRWVRAGCGDQSMAMTQESWTQLRCLPRVAPHRSQRLSRGPKRPGNREERSHLAWCCGWATFCKRPCFHSSAESGTGWHPLLSKMTHAQTHASCVR